MGYTRRLYFIIMLTASSSVALSQPQANSASTNIWWVPIVSALIGAVAALITPFVKDLMIQGWNEARSKSAKQREIFRNYAAPLAAASERLVWRFAEIFIEERHQFLKTATFPLIYNEYKRTSTLYRIACLLGWIRAINLELNALPRGGSGFLTPVSGAIGKVQSALADGPEVELLRLKQMCSIWNLDLDSVDDKKKKSLATQFEVNLYGLAGDALRHDSDHLKSVDLSKKIEICTALCQYLCTELKRAVIPDQIILETLNRAIVGLSYREALIYRDWQDAIGDAMLEQDPDSVRRFRLIGYERFEDVLKGPSLWMEVFRESIVDIDFDAIDPNDFRAKQLRDVAVGVSEIIISLSGAEDKDLVGAPVLGVAKKLAGKKE
jgi:hypothetical protein